MEVSKIMKLLVFSDFDSRLKWGLTLAHYIADMFGKVVVYHREDTLRQVEGYISKDYIIKHYDNRKKLLEREDIFGDFDVIILAMGGTENIYFLNQLNKYFRKHHKRPVIISGMNGLTDCEDMHALLCRIGADIICINSKRNFDVFRERLQYFGIANENLLMFGYARIYKNDTKMVSNIQDGQVMLFIGQANMPSQKKQYKYLMNKIREYASKHPKNTIIIKNRDITHKDHMNAYFKREEIFQLWRWKYRFQKKPNNLIVSNESIEDLLDRADVCLGFYSTALLEAINLGIPTLIINDFGIGRNIGNHDFIESGLLASLDDWIDNKIPSVNQQWKDENCNFVTRREIDQLRNMLINKLKEDRKEIEQYYSEKKFPYFYFKN